MLLAEGGWVAEAGIWSLFWWEDARAAAPPLALGVLPGVARARIAEQTGGVVERRVQAHGSQAGRRPRRMRARGRAAVGARTGSIRRKRVYIRSVVMILGVEQMVLQEGDAYRAGGKRGVGGRIRRRRTVQEEEAAPGVGEGDGPVDGCVRGPTWRRCTRSAPPSGVSSLPGSGCQAPCSCRPAAEGGDTRAGRRGLECARSRSGRASGLDYSCPATRIEQRLEHGRTQDRIPPSSAQGWPLAVEYPGPVPGSAPARSAGSAMPRAPESP